MLIVWSNENMHIIIIIIIIIIIFSYCPHVEYGGMRWNAGCGMEWREIQPQSFAT